MRPFNTCIHRITRTENRLLAIRLELLPRIIVMIDWSASVMIVQVPIDNLIRGPSSVRISLSSHISSVPIRPIKLLMVKIDDNVINTVHNTYE